MSGIDTYEDWLLKSKLRPRDEAHAASGDAEASSPEPVVDAPGAESGPPERGGDGSAELAIGGDAAVAGDRLEAEARHGLEERAWVRVDRNSWALRSDGEFYVRASAMRELLDLEAVEKRGDLILDPETKVAASRIKWFGYSDDGHFLGGTNLSSLTFTDDRLKP